MKHNYSNFLMVDTDWEKSGLLEGLDENHKKTMIDVFNMVGPEFKNHYFHNERMEHYLFPCVRRIYSKLFIEKNDTNVSIDDIDVKYIMTEIDKLYPHMLLLKQNLINIDVEAELIEMFCTNYVKIIEDKNFKVREDSDELNNLVFEFNDDFRQIIKEQEKLSKQKVQDMYPEECKLFDLVVLISFWDAYYIKKPEAGCMIDNNEILDVSNDGVAYFINFVK